MEQWREILRTIRSTSIADTYTYRQPVSHPDVDGYFNANSNSYGYCNSQSNTNWNANGNPYWISNNNSNAEQHAEDHSHTEITPKSKDATYRATAPDARTDSLIATAHSVAATYPAASHNPTAPAILATAYSRPAPLRDGLRPLIPKSHFKFKLHAKKIHF